MTIPEGLAPSGVATGDSQSHEEFTKGLPNPAKQTWLF
jgi:hypothetical protein